MCSSMKQPKPDRLVETDGIPMTVHSADGETTMNYYIVLYWRMSDYNVMDYYVFFKL